MTRPAVLRSFDRAALLLVVAFALGLVVKLVWSSLSLGVTGEIPLGMLGILWLSMPLATAAAFVSASSTRIGAAAFLTLEILLIVSVITMLIPTLGWGSPLGLAFLPVLHAGAIMTVFLVALALGWRMRPDFLGD